MTAAFRASLTAMLASLLLAGCQPQPQASASAAQLAACRRRADDAWAQQNRGEIYQNDNYASVTRDSPLSSANSLGMEPSRLSSLYGHQRMIDDCLNGGQRTTPAPEPTDGAAVPAGSSAPARPAPAPAPPPSPADISGPSSPNNLAAPPASLLH